MNTIDSGTAKMVEDIFNERQERRMQRLKEAKYHPAVKNLLTDGDYIFVFTHERVENEGHIVDVIDSRTGERISRAYFPFGADPIYETMVIKNGYAYRITNNKDGFKIVEKYKIDPAVYRK